MTDNEILIRSRAQIFIVRQAREDLEACIIGLRAVKADGMPHGSTSGDGVYVTIAAKDAAEAALRREEDKLRRYRDDARGVMGGMTDEKRVRFCRLRYIDGLSMKEIKRRLGTAASPRTLDRYRIEIEGKTK